MALKAHTSTQRAHKALKAHTSTQRAHKALKAHTSTQRAHKALKAHTSTQRAHRALKAHTSTQRAHRALKAHTSTQRAHRALKAHTSTQRAHRALKAHTFTRPFRSRIVWFACPGNSAATETSCEPSSRRHRARIPGQLGCARRLRKAGVALNPGERLERAQAWPESRGREAAGRTNQWLFHHSG